MSASATQGHHNEAAVRTDLFWLGG